MTEPRRAGTVLAGSSLVSTVAARAGTSSAGASGGSAGAACTAASALPAATRNLAAAGVSPATGLSPFAGPTGALASGVAGPGARGDVQGAVAAQARRRTGDRERGSGRSGLDRRRREPGQPHGLCRRVSRHDPAQPPRAGQRGGQDDHGHDGGDRPGRARCQQDHRDDHGQHDAGRDGQDRQPPAKVRGQPGQSPSQPAGQPARQGGGLSRVAHPVDRRHPAWRRGRRGHPDVIGVDPLQQRNPASGRPGQPGQCGRPAAERPERPGHPPVAASDHALRHPADGQVGADRARTGQHPGLHGAGQGQHGGRGRDAQVAGPRRGHGGPCQLRGPKLRVGRLDAGHLGPRRGHQRGPLGLHDLGAHPGGSPVTRVGVQLAKPAWLGVIDRQGGRGPLAVERRHDPRVVGSRVVGIVGGRGGGQVDQVLHGGLERVAIGTGPRRRRRLDAAQRAFEAERAARAWHSSRRVVDGHRAAAHLGRQHRGGELAYQRLEVAGVTGTEGELEVDRQPQRRDGLSRPGRVGRVQAADIHPQAGLAADLERRDQERGVRRLGVKSPRAQHPRDGGCRVGCHRGGQLRVTADLGVRPVPRVIERLQRGHDLNVDRRQRVRRHARRGELAGLENDQRDERPQPVAIGPRWREQPGEIRVVELDPGQVVRLEIHGLIARLGPDDVPRIDADHVARAIQVHGHLRRRGVGHRGAVLLCGDVQDHLQRRTVGQPGAVGLACVGADAPPQPGPEVVPGAWRVGRVHDRHAALPSGTS